MHSPTRRSTPHRDADEALSSCRLGAIQDGATLAVGLAALLALILIRRWRPPHIERLAEPLVVLGAEIAGSLLRGT